MHRTFHIGLLVSGLVTGNLLSGYMNWVVGYAHPDQRPVYVGLANTVTALISLIAPFIGGTIAQTLGYRPLFAVALVMALGALFVTVRFMRDVQMGEMHEVAVSSGTV
jgi:MFS family permease